MAVSICPCANEHNDKARKVLEDGTYDNIIPAFLLAIKRWTVITFVSVYSILVYHLTQSLLQTGILIVALYNLLFAVLWYVMHRLIKGPLLADMDDVQVNYQSSDKTNFWVAVTDSDIVIGTVAITVKEKQESVAYLRRMAVSREYRRLGIAKRLLKVALEFCESNGYNQVELITTEVQAPAQRLYESFGFQVVDRWPRKYKGFVLWTYTLLLHL
ncbi:N-acetylaspartate synthetase-like [Anneissia japonica]|uniref:N-acetylaspartate synthetase-like n=1 Tax=Anneissia japonica TaxID=1529436 RepID=UPI0014259A21|nr:N-acetylaspartate synthetase-like [Anneissia japonica]